MSNAFGNNIFQKKKKLLPTSHRNDIKIRIKEARTVFNHCMQCHMTLEPCNTTYKDEDCRDTIERFYDWEISIS